MELIHAKVSISPTTALVPSPRYECEQPAFRSNKRVWDIAPTILNRASFQLTDADRVHLFLACNCGALEVLGLSGIAFRYGVQAFRFYWICAIPALIFLSFVMSPAYVQSGARSLP